MSALPRRRPTVRYRVAVGATTMHVDVGRWPGGGPAEVFVDFQHREGAAFRTVVQILSRTASSALQAGTPLEKVVGQLRSMPFDPCGLADIGGEVVEVQSPLDAVALVLEAEAHDAGGGDLAAFWDSLRAARAL